MTKDTYYFRHDCNARLDERVLALRMKHNWQGYGLYWAIIERLRESNDYECVKDYNLIAYDLRVSAEIVKSIVEDFGLFTFTEDGKRFYSKRLTDDMKTKDELSKLRRAAAKKGNEKRWGKKSQKDEDNPTDNAQETAENVSQINSKPIASASQTDSKCIANAKQMYRKPIAIKEKNRIEKNSITPLICPPTGGSEIGATAEKSSPSSRFVPPTLDEIKAYISKMAYSFSPEHFLDYYTSNGWMVGRNKMRDWKAACRTWQRNQRERQQPQSINPATNKPIQRSATALDISQMDYSTKL